jgi:hypothetical protein
MTLINNEKGKYINEFLRQNLDIAKKVIRKDLDMIFIVDGAEGAGKSVCAMHQAYYCDPTLDINRMCFTPDEFRKAVMKADKYTAVIYDEGFTGLSSRGTMSLINRTIINMLAEIRQKNLFIWVIAPSFFDMDKYLVLHRSRVLIHVYMGDNFERGKFAFYNVDRKKELYINGKKYNNYRTAKPNFIGDFTNWYPIDEAAYRKKKHDSLTKRELSSSDEQLKKEIQDNLFLRLVENELPLTHEVKAKILGIPIATYYYKLKKFEENREIFSDT